LSDFIEVFEEFRRKCHANTSDFRHNCSLI
jgi:hypothetical protein